MHRFTIQIALFTCFTFVSSANSNPVISETSALSEAAICLDKSVVRPKGKEESESCYQGLIPKFHVSPRTKEIWYFQYYAFPHELAKSCFDKDFPPQYKISPTKLINGSLPSLDRSVDPEIYSAPYFLSNKKDGDILKYVNSDLFSIPTIKYQTHLEVNLKATIDPMKLIQTSTPNARTHSISKFLDLPIPFTTKVTDAYIDIFEAEEKLSINHRWEYLPTVTANACWLLATNSEYSDSEEVDNYKKHSIEKKLEIYSFSGEKKDSTNKDICSQPIIRIDTQANRSRDENRGIMKSVHFDLFDFHEKNSKFVTWYGSINSYIPKKIENSSALGIDYTAFSPNPNELEIVYQKGFESDSDDEKKLNGDLVFTAFSKEHEIRRDPDRPHRPFKASVVNAKEFPQGDGTKLYEFNITEKCQLFDGWEYAPKLSIDKRQLFFLAQETGGDDSSKTNLLIADYEKIRKGEFNCTDHDHIANLTHSLDEGDFQILDYDISADSRRISIWYEQNGETVIRFYRLSKSRDRIVYRYPEKISGIGKIHDITTVGFGKSNNKSGPYFVMHSRQDFPVSISRCYFRNSKFNCSDKYSPTNTTSYGNQIISSDGCYAKNRVILDSISKNWVDEEGNSIPGFVLRPKENVLASEAIISVHGGPNESWDGRFSQAEFELASRGYTVFLPNPAGSTGFGYTHTEKGHREWGKRIYRDILRVVNYAKKEERSDKKATYDKVYLMGFSFGGYIANWVQTDPENLAGNSIDALIAINPLFDTLMFAESTDQYWFPQFQLGCSGKNCKSLKCGTKSKLPVLTQNPACYLGCEHRNKLNYSGSNAIPIFIIAGRKDQRVPYCHNIEANLLPYKRRGIPYRFKLVAGGGHDLGAYVGISNGQDIDHWLRNIKQCKSRNGDWDLDCRDHRRRLIFHNLKKHGDQNCLKTIDDIVPSACN